LHFTPTRRSSQPFATDSGSGLHARVPPASPCPRVAHPVSGRLDATAPPFRTRVRSGSGCPCLNLAAPNHSSAHSTKGTPSPGSPPGSDRPEAHGFRLSFTPLAGVLFTVPSRYWSPIGRKRSLALDGGPPRFRPDSACRAVLTQRAHSDQITVAYGALTPSGHPFQQCSAGHPLQARMLPHPPARPSYPHTAPPAGSPAAWVWAAPRSLAATKGILSLPPGTQMFHFPGCPSRHSRARMRGVAPTRVAPFGHPRITGCQRLPGAFRRVAASFLGRLRQGIHRAPISVAAHHRLMPPAPARDVSSHRSQDRSSVVTPVTRLVPRALPLSTCTPPTRWSRGESNPGPPPCKGGALPAKLRPPGRWARLDSNQGPRPYQGRALTT
jgi:hypothetical protein